MDHPRAHHGHAGVVHAPIDQHHLTLVRHDGQTAAVPYTVRGLDGEPSVRVSVLGVHKDFRVRAVADDEGPLARGADGRPDHVRTRAWDLAVGGRAQEVLLGVAKELWVRRDAVVHGVRRVAGQPVGREAQLVGEDVRAVAHLGHGGHARPLGVVGLGGVVHHGTPGLEVGGGLVRQFLPVGWVALVRVRVHHPRRVVADGGHEQKRFPDGSGAVGGVCWPALGDLGDKFP